MLKRQTSVENPPVSRAAKRKIRKIREEISKPRAKFDLDLVSKIECGDIFPQCYRHPKYKGYRRPWSGCQTCLAVWKVFRKLGIKENRKRKA